MKKLALRSHFASSPYGWEIKLVGALADNKRYGYNGTHLRDNEVLGEGNFLDFGGFGYDTRTATRKNIEPYISKFPSLGSYVVFGDNPMKFSDPDGNLLKDPNRKIIYSYLKTKIIGWLLATKNAPDVIVYPKSFCGPIESNAIRSSVDYKVNEKSNNGSNEVNEDEFKSIQNDVKSN